MKTCRYLYILLAAGTAWGPGAGCSLIRRGATGMATELANGLMYQNDVDLVREGTPAFLLILDAMTESQPDNPAVLLAAADAQMAYATGFVDKQDKDRVQRMTLKAKNYGMRVLRKRNKRFAQAMDGTQDEFVESLQGFRRADAKALFTTASAWVMWIIASSDSPAALGDMPKVLAMMTRVQELDPLIQHGGVDLFYGIYYTVMPLGGGRDLDRARTHFEHSMEIAGPDYLMARVTFAEFYARYAFKPELFEETLEQVIAADPQVREFTLMNAVAQQRAQGLLDQLDEWF